MNANLERWIYASICKFFTEAAAVTPATTMYIESAPDPKRPKPADWVELRIDGPKWTSQTKDAWKVRYEVNVLVSSAKNETNNYRFLTLQGKIRAAFQSGAIPILKLGTGAGDDQSFIECLILDARDRESLDICNFGQIDKTSQLMQSSIEGHYYAHLKE